MPKPSVIRFGRFTADLDSGELLREGAKLRLQSQPFQLLTLLLMRPGEVVTRDEVREKLWPADTFVDFDHSLGTAINKIRAALRDSAEEPQFIETLPRRGYRFIGRVDAATEAQSGASLPESTKGPSTQNPDISSPKTHAPVPRPASSSWISSRLSRRLLAGAAVLSIVLAASAAYSRHSSSVHKASVANFQSVAVLPLSNLSSNPEEIYFADGMTDELITNLAKIRSLRVISRTSVMRYRDAHKSVPEIARELGVDAIVEGTVLRNGGRVRITAQLIDGQTDRHLWAEEYERGAQDVLTMQSDITRDIASSVNARLTAGERVALARTRSVDPEVEDLYWKGIYHFNKTTVPDFQRARDYFEQMLQKDPQNARAWTGVAMSNLHLAAWGDISRVPFAKAAALKAIELDDSLAEPHAELGMLTFHFEWNVPEAERQLRRAIELNPNYYRAHSYYSIMLAQLGRSEEAHEQFRQARTLDPLSAFSAAVGWHVFYCARQYEETIKVCRAALEMEPGIASAYGGLILSFEQRGEYEKAIEERVLSVQSGSPYLKRVKHDADRLQRALASGGERGYWKECLALFLENHDPKDPNDLDEAARLYMHLGDRARALDWLEKAYKAHDPFLIFWIVTAPEFDSLHSEPRYQKIVRDMHLTLPS
jgi:TolB-like protein/DNA-binding winged helix-turn-helix (wHTH) protein/tetratricopeptide (TPR) repeat protein